MLAFEPTRRSTIDPVWTRNDILRPRRIGVSLRKRDSLVVDIEEDVSRSKECVPQEESALRAVVGLYTEDTLIWVVCIQGRKHELGKRYGNGEWLAFAVLISDWVGKSEVDLTLSRVTIDIIDRTLAGNVDCYHIQGFCDTCEDIAWDVGIGSAGIEVCCVR